VEYNIIVIKAIEHVAHCPLAEASVFLSNPFLLAGPPHDTRREQQCPAHPARSAVCQPLAPGRAKPRAEGAGGRLCTFTRSLRFSHGAFAIGEGRFSLWGLFWAEGKGAVAGRRKGLWVSFFLTGKGADFHW